MMHHDALFITVTLHLEQWQVGKNHLPTGSLLVTVPRLHLQAVLEPDPMSPRVQSLRSDTVWYSHRGRYPIYYCHHNREVMQITQWLMGMAVKRKWRSRVQKIISPSLSSKNFSNHLCDPACFSRMFLARKLWEAIPANNKTDIEEAIPFQEPLPTIFEMCKEYCMCLSASVGPYLQEGKTLLLEAEPSHAAVPNWATYTTGVGRKLCWCMERYSWFSARLLPFQVSFFPSRRLSQSSARMILTPLKPLPPI